VHVAPAYTRSREESDHFGTVPVYHTQQEDQEVEYFLKGYGSSLSRMDYSATTNILHSKKIDNKLAPTKIFVSSHVKPFQASSS
jgi:hypothetical protein